MKHKELEDNRILKHKDIKLLQGHSEQQCKYLWKIKKMIKEKAGENLKEKK